MQRVVQPEILDHLPASAPWSIRSRADLRRLNQIMGHVRIITGAFSEHLDMETARVRSLRIAELGAGDGSLLLQLAQEWSTMGVTADAELVDLHYLMTEETRRSFTELSWNAISVAMNVTTWLEQTSEVHDLILANLFLHHFQPEQLREMFRKIATKTDFFIACEPRRAPLPLIASHLLWAIGCNPVTRHDAPVSVRAGFDGKELSELWPDRTNWILSEYSAGKFSHCFFAKRYG